MSIPNKRKTSEYNHSKTIMVTNSQTVAIGAERLKTREQFAAELNICSKTMKKYLQEAAYKLPKGLIKVADQERIRQIVLGIPNNSN